MGTPLMELRNINMVFKKRGALLGQDRRIHVLKDINLQINEGEIIALVGESGSGKTTLGKIITGLLEPTKGEILYEGKSIGIHLGNTWENYRNSVQFIQQDSYAALNPARTIYQSMCAAVESNNRKIPLSDKETMVADLLESVGLTPAELFLYKFPHQLSGGQRQRVLMARALALKPKIIVADEPVSMIDVSLRISILDLMLKLNRDRGISFVYITHDFATAKYIADQGKIMVMYLGEIVEKASLSTLLKSPRHPYTQALLSAVPIPDPEVARSSRPIPIKSMELASLENRNEGCSFFERCPYSQELCREKVEERIIEDTIVKCAVKTIPEWNAPFVVGMNRDNQ